MRSYHNVDFLESAQRLSVRTYHNMDLNCSQTLARERHAHRWPSMVRGAMLARTRRAWGYCDSSGERGTQLSAWEGTQTLRRERHAHRWPSTVRGAMLATTWNLSSPPVATILAGEHSRQGLREMLLKTPERGAVPELVYRHPQIAIVTFLKRRCPCPEW